MTCYNSSQTETFSAYLSASPQPSAAVSLTIAPSASPLPTQISTTTPSASATNATTPDVPCEARYAFAAAAAESANAALSALLAAPAPLSPGAVAASSVVGTFVAIALVLGMVRAVTNLVVRMRTEKFKSLVGTQTVESEGSADEREPVMTTNVIGLAQAFFTPPDHGTHPKIETASARSLISMPSSRVLSVPTLRGEQVAMRARLRGESVKLERGSVQTDGTSEPIHFLNNPLRG